MATLAIDYYIGETPKQPDFAAAKSAGARVIMARGAYGRRVNGMVGSTPIFLDPCWERDKEAIVKAGLRRSAYLYVCMPRKGYTTPGPEVQANAFADYVDELRPPTAQYCGDYPPCFDVEEESLLSPDAYFDWCLRVAVTLLKRFGVWPIMYSSQRVWTEYLRDRAAGALRNCPQWVAKPWPWPVRSAAQLDGAPAWQPNTINNFGDATNWLWYQYQGDALGVPGYARTCDLNRCQIVRQGMKGDVVKYVQARVGAIVDGDFGPNTAAAVKTFQTKYGLAADAIIGPDTWAPLTWAPSSTPPFA